MLNEQEAVLTQKKVRKKSQFSLVMGRLIQNKGALVGLIVLIIIILVSILAPLIAPYGYADYDVSVMFAKPSAEHLFGCDELGRDIFSRVLYGGRYSLQIGIFASFGAAIMAVILGSLAGYFGGIVDTIIMRFIDIIQTIPGLLLSVALSAVLGTGLYETMVALAIGQMSGQIRIFRAAVLQVSKTDYIDSAIIDNAKPSSIIVRHIIPNAISPLIVQVTMGAAHVILVAATLSFIGLGVQPPSPEWGAMLSSARNFVRDYPHMLIFPGLAILLTVLSLNLLGDGLRDALDPKLKK